MRLETKIVAANDASLEVKLSGGEAEAVVVSGYASVFGGVDSYEDTVIPGAYRKSIDQWTAGPYPMPMLLNHDRNIVVGRWDALAEDSRGLMVTGSLTPGHSAAADVAANLKWRAVSGLSIGYQTVASDRKKGGVRELQEIALHEISIVTSPADLAARVTGVKSAEEIGSDLRAFEEMLREACGYSHRHAKHIATHGFKSFLREVRDEPTQDEEEALTGDTNDSQRLGGGKEVGELVAFLRGFSLTHT